MAILNFKKLIDLTIQMTSIELEKERSKNQAKEKNQQGE